MQSFIVMKGLLCYCHEAVDWLFHTIRSATQRKGQLKQWLAPVLWPSYYGCLAFANRMYGNCQTLILHVAHDGAERN